MDLGAIIRSNPVKTIVGAASTLATLTVVVTTIFALDGRYAHAADVAAEANKTQQLILQTTQDLRKQQLEDKIFEIDLRKSQSRTQQLTPIDEALRSRYQRQIREMPPNAAQSNKPQ